MAEQPPGRPPGQHGDWAPPQPSPGPWQPGQMPPPHAVPYGQPPRRNDDGMWAIFAYLGMLVVGFIAPLVIFFVMMNKSRFVRFHAAQSLNFVITIFIYLLVIIGLAVGLGVGIGISVGEDAGAAVGLIVGGIPFFLLIIAQYVFLIMAAIKSARGEWYRIPGWICFRMIR